MTQGLPFGSGELSLTRSVAGLAVEAPSFKTPKPRNHRVLFEGLVRQPGAEAAPLQAKLAVLRFCGPTLEAPPPERLPTEFRWPAERYPCRCTNTWHDPNTQQLTHTHTHTSAGLKVRCTNMWHDPNTQQLTHTHTHTQWNLPTTTQVLAYEYGVPNYWKILSRLIAKCAYNFVQYTL